MGALWRLPRLLRGVVSKVFVTGRGRAKLVATVSDFLTVVFSLDAGPMRKGRVRRPEEKTTVRKLLTVMATRCQGRP